MALYNYSSEQTDQELSEINVTPFIDVMLVLLIIFMVTVPISTVTVPLDLPTAQAKVEPNLEKPIILSLNRERELYLGDEKVLNDNLGEEIDKLTQAKRDTVIFLQIDKTVPYEYLMDIMNQLRSAGYFKIGLVGLGPDTENH
ncbi:biopolymer transporter ExbD [Gallibacterium salpingitidis]|uniref:biopolymer transporter ExbD n=1 Tax=Gallibacterium salpingitidis TaxID=505341 RepID=UPI002670BFAB|nr:biopolymer transporter ExbD [Gallibacterium salpingitidis]WKS99849.1 biopolymer transporter ExbD [Gallibacterium salpingitidis]